MNSEIIQTLGYIIGCLFSVVFILAAFFAAFSYYKYIQKQERQGINFNGDMKRAILENAVDEMAATTVRDSHGYIQNNNMTIEKHLKVFTPSFDAKHFSVFGARLFKRLVQSKGKEELPLAGKNIDMTALPPSIARVDLFYLHNYIIRNNNESLKMFCEIKTEDGEREKYFLTFSRENPLIQLKDSKTLTVCCPSCGSEIDMDKRLVGECPYCHSTIIFTEYDWVLNEVEHITPDTKICNLAIFKNSPFTAVGING